MSFRCVVLLRLFSLSLSHTQHVQMQGHPKMPPLSSKACTIIRYSGRNPVDHWKTFILFLLTLALTVTPTIPTLSVASDHSVLVRRPDTQGPTTRPHYPSRQYRDNVPIPLCTVTVCPRCWGGRGGGDLSDIATRTLYVSEKCSWSSPKILVLVQRSKLYKW